MLAWITFCRKTVSVLFLALLLPAASFGCSEASSPPSQSPTQSPFQSPTPSAAAPVPYTDPSSGVSLIYPQGWKTETIGSGGQAQLQITSPDGQAMFFLQVAACPAGTPMFDQMTADQLSQYAKDSWDQFKNGMASVITPDGSPTITYRMIGGRKFVNYEANGKVQADSSGTYKYIICAGVYSGKLTLLGYFVNTAAPAGTQESLDAMISSVDLHESPASQAAATAAPLVSYVDAASGIGLQYPGDWAVRTIGSGDLTQLQLAPPSGSGMMFIQGGNAPKGSLMFDQVSDKRIDKYAVAAWKQFENALSLTITIDAEPEASLQTVGGLDFVFYQVNGTQIADGKKCAYNIYVGLYDGKCYIFGFATLATASQQDQDAMSAVLASFQFNAQGGAAATAAPTDNSDS